MVAVSPGRRLPASTALALAAVVVLGLVLRVWGLDGHGLTHAEVYVPRLSMPDYVSAPPPRHTLPATVLGTLHHDNHPPGYYALMWVWTALAGTGLFALRLPSALAGAATVALLFWAVRPRDGRRIALTAAALLALHGHHLFWSQQARMWVFLGLLAVLSVVLLQSLERRARAGPAVAYVVVIATGLWLEYSFWPFVAAQIAWASFRHCRARRLPTAVELAILALIAAAPVLAFLQAHIGMERTAYLARESLFDLLTRFFLLQWLVKNPASGESFGPVATIAVLLLLVAGAVLLGVGVVARRAPDPAAREEAEPVATTPGLWVLAALAPTFFGAWLVAQGERGVTAVASVALPWLLLAVGQGAARSWPVWSRWLQRLRVNSFVRRATDDAAVMHALLPLAILLGAGLVVPSVAARSLLFVTPFALWLVARGLATALPHPAARGVGTAALLVAGVFSVYQYTRPELGEQSPYQSLAAVLRPELQPDDLVLINDTWWSQPMHYYLPPDRYRTGHFGTVPGGEVGERVWVLLLEPGDQEALRSLATRLRGYRQGRRVSAVGSHAVLLVRRVSPDPPDAALDDSPSS